MDAPQLARLEAGLSAAAEAPRDHGRVELVVARPAVDERVVLETARLDVEQGLVGDMWSTRPSKDGPGGGPHPLRQVTVMNARVIELLAGAPERWALAGDQLFVDLDLSPANLPAGTVLSIGTAQIEVTPAPHRGCAKFARRFGPEATRVVNSPAGVALNARGINTRVIRSGDVRSGDAISKVPAQETGNGS